MYRLILTLALCLPVVCNAALRGGGSGQSTPRPTNPTPDTPPVSWQPPFTILR